MTRYRDDCEHNADLAQLVQTKLDALKAQDPTLGENSTKTQLLILDRGFDPSSALLHEYRLQAMAGDLLGLMGEVYTYIDDKGVEKRAEMNERNALWKQLKHKHIAEVGQVLGAKQKELTKYEEEIKASGHKGMNVAIKKMPKHEKDKTEHFHMMHLAQQCFSVNDDKRIKKLNEVEQGFVTGQDSEGSRVKNPMASLVRTLKDQKFSVLDKVRVILLYALSQDGISQDDLTKMIEHGGIPPEEAAMIQKLGLLGVTVVREPGHEATWQVARARRPPTPFTTSRWTPVLRDVLEQAMDDRLDVTRFPFLRPGTEARQGAPASARQYGQFHQFHRKARIVVFIAGGVSHSELAVGAQVAGERADWEVVVGGSALLSPTTFLEGVAGVREADRLNIEQEKQPLLK